MILLNILESKGMGIREEAFDILMVALLESNNIKVIEIINKFL